MFLDIKHGALVGKRIVEVNKALDKQLNMSMALNRIYLHNNTLDAI
jgi:hypothetical protein